MISKDAADYCLLNQQELFSRSPEETHSLAKDFSKVLLPGDLVTLKGNLGAGKTTFVKALIHYLCGVNPDEISSPTFTYLNIYNTTPTVNHFDFYRITSEEQAIQLGLDEHINDYSIALVEWPERAPSIVKKPSYEVEIFYLGQTERAIKIKSLKNEKT